MSDEAPPAGWYPNPDGTGGLRWWSGVGWTDYTREGAAPTASAQPAQPAPEPVQPTEVLGEPATATPEPAPASGEQPTTALAGQTDQSQWANPWGQPVAPTPAAPIGAYAPYAPPPAAPLTPSGMRPLSDMFADIGRITKRAWFPILGIPFILWAVVTGVLVAVLLSAVNVAAFRRGLDALATEVQTNPDGSISSEAGNKIVADFSEAFSRLSPGAWAVLGVLLLLLFGIASFVQVAAVSRLSMDAAAGRPVTWGAGWKSGFVGGMRLLGYWLLIGIIALVAFLAVTVLIALVAQVAPPLAALLGVAAFFGAIVVAFLLMGRFAPVAPQAVVGRHALRWSWTHTKGKYWAVLGRYLLWAVAASIIIQVISTIIAIPVSLLFLGQLSSASSVDQLGASLELQLILLPFSMALGAITVLGITPIWRDLTDDPEYRSIDENGIPLPAPE